MSTRHSRAEPVPLREARNAPPTAADPCPATAIIPAVQPPRVRIEAVTPEIDAGRFPIKRIAKSTVTVEATVFADGHDVIRGFLRHRHCGQPHWIETPLAALGNDRWRAQFAVTAIGRYEYTVVAWVDRFASWQDALRKKVEAAQAVTAELLEGARLLQAAAECVGGDDGDMLRAASRHLSSAAPEAERIDAALDDGLTAMAARADRSHAATYMPALGVVVERPRAAIGAWYEMFPRSASPVPGVHGTLRDTIGLLPYVAEMGFDVLYLPPIHPVGATLRKGKDNTPGAGPDDPGSPWGIGAGAGGHKSVHPDLGTLDDFDALVAAARGYRIEIALDLAFQCSPDHPYVRQHPEWFRHRPDGSIQYAENPPKKYEDIYPFDFNCAEWQALWQELRSIVTFWIGHGVNIFRVDNPHTKPLAFWEWLIDSVRGDYPDVVFLAEAFTRPAVMRALAKLGFSQSYTYFTWRNSKHELVEYFTELTQTPVREYLRPNLFVNTPDILHEFLQFGGRPAFIIRLILAATLGPSYGIYGPAFELCEARAVAGTEEYAHSEKYELRQWARDAADGLQPLIARVNRIRREDPALYCNDSLQFYPIDNEQLLVYGKSTPDLANIVLVAVNLDPHHTQIGWVDVPIDAFGIDAAEPYQVHDLLSEARYLWHGRRNYVALDPHVMPAHILRVRRHIRNERDFDYFA